VSTIRTVDLLTKELHARDAYESVLALVSRGGTTIIPAGRPAAHSLCSIVLQNSRGQIFPKMIAVKQVVNATTDRVQEPSNLCDYAGNLARLSLTNAHSR
jgi:hypothetical protein